MDKIIDLKRQNLDTGNLPLFLHIMVSDKNHYRVQLSDKKGNIDIYKEKVISFVKVPHKDLIVVGQTEDIRQLGMTKTKAIKEAEKKLERKQGPAIAKVLRIKQSKFVYLFVDRDEHNDMMEYLRSTQVEFRLTVGPSWEN